jgi:hypothetical protein
VTPLALPFTLLMVLIMSLSLATGFGYFAVAALAIVSNFLSGSVAELPAE